MEGFMVDLSSSSMVFEVSVKGYVVTPVFGREFGDGFGRKKDIFEV